MVIETLCSVDFRVRWLFYVCICIEDILFSLFLFSCFSILICFVFLIFLFPNSFFPVFYPLLKLNLKQKQKQMLTNGKHHIKCPAEQYFFSGCRFIESDIWLCFPFSSTEYWRPKQNAPSPSRFGATQAKLITSLYLER